MEDSLLQVLLVTNTLILVVVVVVFTGILILMYKFYQKVTDVAGAAEVVKESLHRAIAMSGVAHSARTVRRLLHKIT